MAVEDYFDSYDEDNDDQPILKECKFCGKGNLIWEELEEGKWRLLEKSGKIHSCLSKRIPLSLDKKI